MSHARRVFCPLLLLIGSFFLTFPPAHAQDVEQAKEAFIEVSRKVTPKQVILILDTSKSMISGESRKRTGDGETMMKHCSLAVKNILNRAIKSGDTVVFQTFGSATVTPVDTIYKGDDIQKLKDAVPSQPGEGQGTNIRHPHHDALKRAEDYKGSTFIVLLTDSYNDQPAQNTNEWEDYLRYYDRWKLTEYPNTDANNEYVRLLAAHPGITYGIGIKIDEVTGRPIERDPTKTLPVEATPEPVASATPVPVKQPESYPFLPYLLGILPLLIGGVVVFLMMKPVPLRISGGSGASGGQKDFQVKGNSPVRLGGDGASFSSDAYPIAGVKEVVATVTGSRGSFSLHPTAQLPAGLRVYHNGVPLQGVVPLRYGDELRVSVPDANGVTKEVRLKFSDPNKPF
jgi:hypothetical protein